MRKVSLYFKIKAQVFKIEKDGDVAKLQQKCMMQGYLQ
jgi:hypothetical protein